MARCAYCGARILLGGKREGQFRFCNDRCLEEGALLFVADQVAPEKLQELVDNVHSGQCPECHGPGPVDVHRSYRVWSAVFMTSSNSRVQVCCRACGNKSRAADILFCLVLGWWGVPWGLLLTPIQVIRNLAGMFAGADLRPSERLESICRQELAANALATERTCVLR